MKSALRPSYKLLAELLLLTVFFIFIEISFFIQSVHGYLDDFNFIAHKINIPYAIIPEVLFFIVAQLLLHLGFVLAIWFFTLVLSLSLKCSESMQNKLGLLLWLLGILSILLLNQHFFPNSKFSTLSRFLFPDFLAIGLIVFLACLWIVLLILSVYYLFSFLSGLKKIFLIAVLISLGYYWNDRPYFYLSSDAGTEKKPNIILIGIDSLRPDFLDYFGSQLKTNFFNHFLPESTVFSRNFTPLARTFPSWISILSGAYPKESGIRFNLAPQNKDLKSILLPFILHRQGYKTIFATDETRFSNIDKSYGFDEIISPPLGLNDFLLGSFNDFPLSNLLVNTVIGKWLFPYSYANRPAYVTYDPDSFLSLLRPHLKAERKQPLFLAVHFCLPHHPYLWAAYPGFLQKDSVHRYQASILRVDQQLNSFMTMLERYQLLKHALVVLFSDHGEALELPGDRITSPLAFLSNKGGSLNNLPRFYPPSADEEAVNQSAGHGTDVLGFPQYYTLLAFQLYGLKGQLARKITEPTLLLDIKPTILHFLKIPDNNSGHSLVNLILGKEAPHFLSSRSIFLESDFSPEAVRSVHPETRNLIFEGIELFRIDPQSTRIYVKDSMGQLILSSKQYALVNKDWVLALYPQAKGKMIPVLVQLSTGKWTTDMSISFAQESPLKGMLRTLKKFYGTELKQLDIHSFSS